jgi:hypothetical protein
VHLAAAGLAVYSGSPSHTTRIYVATEPSSVFFCLVGLLLFSNYGWMPHNAGFGFLDLTPSILLLRQFWD